MALLISKADFAGHIDISANMSNNKLNPQIQLAQDIDLKNLMSDKMYYSFIAGYATAPYNALFTGGTFVVDGITYTNPGVKIVLIFLTASRLEKTGGLDTHFTPNGMMQKRNEFSDPIELKERIFAGNQYENIAIAYWNDCKTYLDNNTTIFPYWKEDCGCENKSQFRPKITAVGHKEEYYRPPYGIRRR